MEHEVAARGDDKPYDEEFYARQVDPSRHSAECVVPLVLDLVTPRSVIDVGCGVGAWLSVFHDLGIEDIVGLDGEYVPRDRLQIPAASFTPTDLNMTFRSDRTFDLAVSVEVAEHLPVLRAASFIENLCTLSDHVLFSAAVPGQGGRAHINEQWPSYWTRLFAAQGFGVRDALRPAIWNDEQIAYWYRQNLLLFSRGYPDESAGPLDVRHPAAPFQPPEQLALGDVVRLLPGLVRASAQFRARGVRERLRPGRTS